MNKIKQFRTAEGIQKVKLAREIKAMSPMDKLKMMRELKTDTDSTEKPLTQEAKAQGQQQVIKSKKARLEANQRAVDVLSKHNHSLDRNDYSQDEINDLLKFSGFGGLGKGDNDEYYTPKEVAQTSWELLGAEAGDEILDTSAGTGIFSSTAPTGVKIKGVELNNTSGAIAHITNDNTDITQSSFEEFVSTARDKKFDGIITNVPFGKRENLYKQKDRDYADIENNDDYFIVRALDLLRQGKRAVFLTSSSLVQRRDRIKQRIIKKASFLGGFRLPSKAFQDTGTTTVVDILVFEKHPDEIVKLLEKGKTSHEEYNKYSSSFETNQDFIDGDYFKVHPKNVLGKFESKEDRKGSVSHFREERDVVELQKGVSIKDAFKMLGSRVSIMMKKFKNELDYKALVGLVDNEYPKSQEPLENSTKNIIAQVLEALDDKKLSLLPQDKDIYEAYSDILSGDYTLGYKDIAMYELKVFADILSKRNNTNTSGDYLLAMLDMLTDGYTGDKHLLEVFGTNKDIRTMLKDTVELKRSGILSIIKTAIGDGITKVELSTLDEEKSLGDTNPHEVINGEKVFSLETFDKKQLESNKEYNFAMDKDGKLVVKTFEDILSSFDGLGLDAALKKISKIKNDGSLDPVLFLNKIEELKERIEDHTNKRNTLSKQITWATFKNIVAKEMGAGQAIKIASISLNDNAIKSIFKEKIKKFKKLAVDELIRFDLNDIPHWNPNSYACVKLFNGMVEKLATPNTLEKFDKDGRKLDEAILKNNAGQVKVDGYRTTDKEEKEQRAVIISIFSRTLRALMPFFEININRYMYNHQGIRDIINKYDDDNRVVKLPLGYNTKKTAPLKQLTGMMKQSTIDKLHGYQNEDANHFGTKLSGTIAQDTGLGKTKTMIGTALVALQSNRAKRVIIFTPDGVIPNFVTELFDDLEDGFKHKVAVLRNKKIKIAGDLPNMDRSISKEFSRIMKSKDVRLIVASHPIAEYMYLGENTEYSLFYEPSTEDGTKSKRTTSFGSYIGKTPTEDKDGDKKWELYDFKAMQIDFIIIDEQQAFKNMGKAISGTGGKQAFKAINMAFLTEYVRKSRGDGVGSVMATATPHTNSIGEIFTNMILAGEMEKDGVEKIGRYNDFVNQYVDVEEISAPKMGGYGYTTKKVVSLTGITSLKDKLGIRYRDAEIEIAKVPTLKIKPPFEEIEANNTADSVAMDAFKGLAVLNDAFRVSRGFGKEKIQTNYHTLTGADKHTRFLTDTIGETFSFINKGKLGSINATMGMGSIPIKIKSSVKIEDLMDILGETKHFNYAPHLYNVNKQGELSTAAKGIASIYQVANNEYREWLLAGTEETRRIEAITKDMESEEAREPITREKKMDYHRLLKYQKDVKQAKIDLALPVISKGKGFSTFNCYTPDDKELHAVVNKLDKANILVSGGFEVKAFPKYNKLVQLLAERFKQYDDYKQIVFSDQPLTTKLIIKKILQEKVKDGTLPKDTNITVFGETKKDTYEEQEAFNTSSTPDVLIYGIKQIVGVNFNKKVSTVHLMNIPDTPDIYHQAAGRGVRQGNECDKVAVYKYFQEGSLDGVSKKRLEDKKNWQTALKPDMMQESDEYKDIDFIQAETTDTNQILKDAIIMFGGMDDNGEPKDIGVAWDLYAEYLKGERVKDNKMVSRMKTSEQITSFDRLIDNVTDSNSRKIRKLTGIDGYTQEPTDVFQLLEINSTGLFEKAFVKLIQEELKRYFTKKDITLYSTIDDLRKIKLNKDEIVGNVEQSIVGIVDRVEAFEVSRDKEVAELQKEVKKLGKKKENKSKVEQTKKVIDRLKQTENYDGINLGSFNTFSAILRKLAGVKQTSTPFLLKAITGYTEKHTEQQIDKYNTTLDSYVYAKENITNSLALLTGEMNEARYNKGDYTELAQEYNDLLYTLKREDLIPQSTPEIKPSNTTTEETEMDSVEYDGFSSEELTQIALTEKYKKKQKLIKEKIRLNPKYYDGIDMSLYLKAKKEYKKDVFSKTSLASCIDAMLYRQKRVENQDSSEYGEETRKTNEFFLYLYYVELLDNRGYSFSQITEMMEKVRKVYEVQPETSLMGIEGKSYHSLTERPLDTDSITANEMEKFSQAQGIEKVKLAKQIKAMSPVDKLNMLKEFKKQTEPKITAVNIAEYYPTMSDVEKWEHKYILRGIFYERNALIKEFLFPVETEAINKNHKNKMEFAVQMGKSMKLIGDSYKKSDIDMVVFGAKDNLQPIDKYIAEIKGSSQYKAYMEAKEQELGILILTLQEKVAKGLYPDKSYSETNIIYRISVEIDKIKTENIEKPIFSTLSKNSDEIQQKVLDIIKKQGYIQKEEENFGLKYQDNRGNFLAEVDTGNDRSTIVKFRKRDSLLFDSEGECISFVEESIALLYKVIKKELKGFYDKRAMANRRAAIKTLSNLVIVNRDTNMYEPIDITPKVLKTTDFKHSKDLGFQAGLNSDTVIHYLISKHNITAYRGFGNFFEEGDDPSFWVEIDNKKITFKDIMNKEKLVEKVNGIANTHSSKVGNKSTKTDTDSVSSKPKEVAVIFVQDSETGKYLLGQRRDSGRWTTPAGGYERRDATIYATAKRELREETGIELEFSRFRKIGAKFIKADNVNTTIFKVSINPEKYEISNKLDKDREFSRILWYNTKQLKKLPLHHKQNLLHKYLFGGGL